MNRPVKEALLTFALLVPVVLLMKLYQSLTGADLPDGSFFVAGLSTGLLVGFSGICK